MKHRPVLDSEKVFLSHGEGPPQVAATQRKGMEMRAVSLLTLRGFRFGSRLACPK
jgi:hypothetical protein